MKPFPVKPFAQAFTRKPFAQAFTRGLWGLAMSLSVDAGADVGVAMSLTVDAGADVASSLDEDSEYERCSPSRELIPDSGHCETQEVSEVNVAPLDVSAPPVTDTRGCGEASSSGVWCRGRLVQHPYLQRDDVGSYGVYVGNWSGRRKLAVINDHIAADLIARNPAQILIAQEVDQQFIKALRDPESSKEAKSAPHVVKGQDTPTVVGEGKGRNYNERPRNLNQWHVATGTEGDGSEASTLIVAARSPLAISCTRVEWQKKFHCTYKKGGKEHNCYSRILVAQVEWAAPLWGLKNVQILNLHFHHLVAKKVRQPARKHHGEEFLQTPTSRETLHHGVFVLAKTPW